MLLAAGLRSLSMAPALVGHAKRAIAAIDLRSFDASNPWPS
jgi:phosphoenolpyruvate-protein kinase (PTS system EI component)